MYSLSQKQRVLSLFIDLLILLSICFGITKHFYPPLGESGFWFYTALLSVLVGSKIITPFYVKPVDAISYTVPAFISLMLINNWEQWGGDIKIAFIGVTSICLLILLTGMIAIVLNNWGNEKIQSFSNNLRSIIQIIAKPQVIYIPIIIFSMIAYHRTNTNEVILISIGMVLTVGASIGDILISIYNRIFQTIAVDKDVSVIAEVIAYQQPDIILLRQLSSTDVPLKTLVFIKDKFDIFKIALTLDLVGRDNGILIRAVEITNLSTNKYKMHSSIINDNFVALLGTQVMKEICNAEHIDFSIEKNVVGIVAPDTTIERLFFEVVDNSNLEEGRLVSVEIQEKKVLYQIVGGLTKEEIVHQKNTYGYLRTQAQQIGIWDSTDHKFKQFSWLPSLNTPVYLEEQQDYSIEPNTIGHFPDSNFQVRISNIDHMVTHNTAILGILGVGKSMLAIELLERMMAQNIKVVCLDLTDQYATELTDYYNTEFEEQCLQRLRTATGQDRDVWNENPSEGGSLPNLKQAIYEDLSDFINGDHNHTLKIYNPAEFVATRQDRAPSNYQTNGEWQRRATLFGVSPVEITQIVSEIVLEILSTEMSDTARVCLVYEEAHSLIPEWNSVVADGDKQATSGTARAILQGRKFGLGCMLITQRTANVTKTILNQCNTIFAMRTFDDTGKDFLGNYIGKDYAESLSSIRERHAVFFGKASSCENPVLMKVNNRNDFLSSFRATHTPPTFEPVVSPQVESEAPSQTEESTSTTNDDLPF